MAQKVLLMPIPLTFREYYCTNTILHMTVRTKTCKHCGPHAMKHMPPSHPHPYRMHTGMSMQRDCLHERACLSLTLCMQCMTYAEHRTITTQKLN